MRYIKSDKEEFEFNGNCPECNSDQLEQDTSCYDSDSQTLDCLECECHFEIFSRGWYVGIIDNQILKEKEL